jgi:hypothetical protein
MSETLTHINCSFKSNAFTHAAFVNFQLADRWVYKTVMAARPGRQFVRQASGGE